MPESLSPASWSVELFRQMDWRRFHELVETVLHRRGFHAWPLRAEADGGRTLKLIRHETVAEDGEALAQLAGWYGLHPSPRALRGLLDQQMSLGLTRSYFVAPADFPEDSVAFARRSGITLIDGRAVVGMIGRLTRAEQDTLFQLATWGDWSVPTCPGCGIKLLLRETEVPAHDGPLEAVDFWENETVTCELRVDSLRVHPGASVTFKRPVHARQIVVEGSATGVFICDGRLTIASGAVLNGQVAARSIDTREGGVLNGDAHVIASGEMRPPVPLPLRHVWGCPNFPRCRITLEPRQPESAPAV